ncbi:MAG: hypothetical protein JNM76_14535 [Betaproteobacteria bacterium]|nr:hypothetical protein [Betaproteobacteria bacterium]
MIPPAWLLAPLGWLKSAVVGTFKLAIEWPRTTLAIVACIAAWFAHGWDVDRKLAAQAERYAQRDAAIRREHQSAVADYVVAMSARITTLRAERDAAAGRVQTEIQLIKERTRDYITPLSVSRCVVPRGFVLHHDAAWSGDLAALARSPGALVDEPSGVPLDRVADINADNAGTCRQLAIDVDAWERWYIDRRDAWESFRAERARRAAIEVKP